MQDKKKHCQPSECKNGGKREKKTEKRDVKQKVLWYYGGDI
jgi:hypothetical protein